MCLQLLLLEKNIRPLGYWSGRRSCSSSKRDLNLELLGYLCWAMEALMSPLSHEDVVAKFLVDLKNLFKINIEVERQVCWTLWWNVDVSDADWCGGVV